jgi:hypothetical protein
MADLGPAWIAFASGIMGGLIGMGGTALTMRSQLKLAREDRVSTQQRELWSAKRSAFTEYLVAVEAWRSLCEMHARAHDGKFPGERNKGHLELTRCSAAVELLWGGAVDNATTELHKALQAMQDYVIAEGVELDLGTEEWAKVRTAVLRARDSVIREARRELPQPLR